MKNVLFTVNTIIVFMVFSFMMRPESIITQIILVFVLVVSLLIANKYKKNHLWHSKKIDNISKNDMIMFTALNILFPIFYAIGLLIIYKESFQDNTFTKISKEAMNISIYISIIIISPILEEYFFRKVFTNHFIFLKKEKVGIVLSSIIFTLLHPLGLKSPLLFLSAISYGWVYLKTRSVIITIILHSISNIGYIIMLKYNLTGAIIYFILPVIFLLGIRKIKGTVMYKKIRI